MVGGRMTIYNNQAGLIELKIHFSWKATSGIGLIENGRFFFLASQIFYRSVMIISIQAENGQDEWTGTKQVKFTTILIWDFSFKVHLLINHHLTVILQTLNYVNVSFLYTRQCQNKI